jgi:hypothetical protein
VYSYKSVLCQSTAVKSTPYGELRIVNEVCVLHVCSQKCSSLGLWSLATNKARPSDCLGDNFARVGSRTRPPWVRQGCCSTVQVSIHKRLLKPTCQPCNGNPRPFVSSRLFSLSRATLKQAKTGVARSRCKVGGNSKAFCPFRAQETRPAGITTGNTAWPSIPRRAHTTSSQLSGSRFAWRRNSCITNPGGGKKKRRGGESKLATA